MCTDDRILEEARKAHQMTPERRREYLTKKAKTMREKGFDDFAIAKELFLNESSVRDLFEKSN